MLTNSIIQIYNMLILIKSNKPKHMKILKLFMVIFVFFSGLNAQQEKEIDSLKADTLNLLNQEKKNFKFFGVTQFTFNQAYFENWVSGGENSVTGLLTVDYNINYLDKKKWVWDNNIMLSLGTTYLSGNSFFKKADDRLEINSVLSKKVNTYWNYSAYFNFKTQLLPGYRFYTEDGEDRKEEVSQILSPAIIQLGLGWYYKENDLAWFNISPLAARGIFVNKNYTQNLSPGEKYFGVERGASSIVSVGASFSGFMRSKLMENISMDNKFNFYFNYLYKIKNIDFEWNANIRLQVNEKISASLIVHLQYDDDLIKRLQIRELFGLGLVIDI
ncbi:MAG TPA: hypothetical protein DHV04_04145 [Flavobacteriaceae bacterium]|nr:hypothetical protein [Flavobacteriaceae bacterium]